MPHESCNGAEAAEKSCRNEGVESRAPHLLMIPHPALPHITPMVHVAEQLVRLLEGNIKLTILSFEHLIEPVVKSFGNLSEQINFIGLRLDLAYTPPPGAMGVEIDIAEMSLAVNDYAEKELLPGSSSPGLPTCIISDVLQYWTADLAAKLNIPRCLLWASGAYSLYGMTALSNRIPQLDDEGESRIAEIFWDRVGKYVVGSIAGSAGILINSFNEFEPKHVESIRRDFQVDVFPVGPLDSAVRVSQICFEDDVEYVDDECLRWLEQQSACSVVYVNFGTTGMQAWSIEHVHELALGLEASQARFLWVLRPPPSVTKEEMPNLLPPGFEERVKDRGLIVRGWAPQLKILSHPSVAVFLMHCGWNSVLESIVRGVPIIGWPSFADQLPNARYIAEHERVALLLPVDASGFVDRGEVTNTVVTAMSTELGKRLKERAEQLKASAAAAIEEGGSSQQSFLKLANLIRQ